MSNKLIEIFRKGDDLEKIYQRQVSAIGMFGFISKKQLLQFLEIASKDSSLEDKYFELSTGYNTQNGWREVSKVLADFIKETIGGKK